MNDASHGKGTALEDCVHNVQRHRTEHEHEFQRLGHAGEEDRQCGGNEHGLILRPLVGVHAAIHCQGNAQQQAGGTDHLAHLEAGRGHGGQQVAVSRHVAGLFEVDEVVGPCQPQRILTEHLAAGIDAGGDRIGAAEGGVVHGDGQHVMQTEGQQETLQCTVNKGRQDRRGLGGIGDPDAEVVDAGLHHRPEHRQHQGNDRRVGNDHHRHETLAVEEGQRIRQLAEIVILIVRHAAHEAGNDAHEHAHVQRRRTQHGGEVAVDRDLLTEQRMRHGIGICQHGTGDAEDVAGDHVDERKGQYGRECAAGTLLRPAAADGHREEDMQVVDDGPADVLHGGADGHHCVNVGAAHLHQLAQTDHQSGCGHNGDDRHQHLAQLLQKVKVDEALFLRLLRRSLRRSFCCRFRGLHLGCQGHDLCFARLCRAFSTMQCHPLCTVRQNNGCDRLQAMPADHVKIDLGHRLPRLDLVARLDEDLEALALQLQRFQTDMDQNLRSVVCRKADGMLCFRNGCYGAVHRAAEQSVRRFNGDTLAQNTAGKGFIRDLLQRDQFSAEGCCHDSRARLGCHDIPPCCCICTIQRNHCTVIALIYATRIDLLRKFNNSFMESK